VRNAALKQLRTQTRRLRREESFADTTPAWFQTDPGLDLDAQQAERALRELPDDEREIVTLRIWGGLTLDEIASVVGASVATVFRRYRSALESLRHEMNVLCHSRIN
jgi:RNA polymerase sigma-70 factor (ECF subfamily)